MKLDVLTTDNTNILLEDFKFEAFWKEYTIKAWFRFDGWSLPRPLRFLSHPLYYPYLKAFLIHDRFYSNGLVDRIFADILFYKMVGEHNELKGILFFIWVFLFWSKYYNEQWKIKSG